MAEVAEQDALEILVEQRLRHHDVEGGSDTMTIFRVPAHVRDASKELYEPRLVSIGPYYRGREALRAMEQHKWRYLHELLAEAEHRPRISLADCVRAVRDVEQQARRCYSERTHIFDAAAVSFAEMLLLDGCFILQFFIKWHNKKEDRLCDVGWGLPLLLSDLLLVDNQIPYFVLVNLFHVVVPEAEISDLRRLILPHFRFHYYSTLSLYREPSSTEVASQPAERIHHLLHLIYEAIVPLAEMELVEDPHSQPWLPTCMAKLRDWFKMAVAKKFHLVGDTQGDNGEPLVVPSVTMLREAGVRFVKKKSPRHLFDITFDKKNGVMEMPRVAIDEASKPLLVNLIALEQTRCLPGTAALWFSSYTALMSFLVKTGKDVEQLHKRGIMDNLLDSDDDAATSFFQKLCGCGTLDYEHHHFQEMFSDLRQYYDSSWHKYKAMFLHDYCRSPWALVALAVAVFAFGSTLFKVSSAIYSLVQ